MVCSVCEKVFGISDIMSDEKMITIRPHQPLRSSPRGQRPRGAPAEGGCRARGVRKILKSGCVLLLSKPFVGIFKGQ